MEWIQLAQVIDKWQHCEHESALLGFQKWQGIFNCLSEYRSPWKALLHAVRQILNTEDDM
jgi:nitrate reductase assembly molybdenum cofactor insertion protein NarJ